MTPVAKQQELLGGQSSGPSQAMVVSPAEHEDEEHVGVPLLGTQQRVPAAQLEVPHTTPAPGDPPAPVPPAPSPPVPRPPAPVPPLPVAPSVVPPEPERRTSAAASRFPEGPSSEASPVPPVAASSEESRRPAPPSPLPPLPVPPAP